MARSKGQMKASRQKGRNFERDCEASIKQVFKDIYMTHEKGYIQQYDLRDDDRKIVVECKKHKSITWNQAEKWFNKLESIKPEGYLPFLIFQSNHQPILIMHQYRNFKGSLITAISRFESVFNTKFIKHETIKMGVK